MSSFIIKFTIPVTGKELYVFTDLVAGLRSPFWKEDFYLSDLSPLTGEELAFMIDSIYNSDNPGFFNSPEAKFIRDEIKFGVETSILNIWTPQSVRNPGLYTIFEDTETDVSKISIGELEDLLSGGETLKKVRFSKDRRVAFAPIDTITSSYRNKEWKLSQDGAFIANFGVEGAERLERAAEKLPSKPSSRIPGKCDDAYKTYSSLMWSSGEKGWGIEGYFEKPPHGYGGGWVGLTFAKRKRTSYMGILNRTCF